MYVRKYCLCGSKFERTVTDEDVAREVVALWRTEHRGEGHGPATFREYQRAVRRIIARNARVMHPKDFKRMRTPLTLSIGDRRGDEGADEVDSGTV